MSCYHKWPALGFMGICLPVRYGGAGLDYLSLGIISEGLEYADSSVRETIAVHLGLHALPIFQWGTAEQKRDFLPPLARGERIACFGLTEPGAGSDVAAMSSRARRDGGDYVLSGEKMWITLADVADRFLVFAKTDPEQGGRRHHRLHPGARLAGADHRHHRGQDGRARQQHRLDQHGRGARAGHAPAGRWRAKGSRSP
jgi:alkylation response protein AidB-like acyl-CoA dehydrogenase